MKRVFLSSLFAHAGVCTALISVAGPMAQNAPQPSVYDMVFVPQPQGVDAPAPQAKPASSQAPRAPHKAVMAGTPRSKIPPLPAAPLPSFMPQPPYPVEAQAQNIEGRVLVHATLTPSGHVQSVRVSSSSGHSILDQAALKTVATWRLSLNAHKGMKEIQIPVEFRLTKVGEICSFKDI